MHGGNRQNIKTSEYIRKSNTKEMGTAYRKKEDAGDGIADLTTNRVRDMQNMLL